MGAYEIVSYLKRKVKRAFVTILIGTITFWTYSD